MSVRLQWPVLLLAACSSLSFAGQENKQPLPVLEEESADAFQPVIDKVRAGMEPGGQYEYMRKSDREEVNRHLDEMKAMIAKAGTVAAMKEEDKVTLFNTQEKINAILLHNDSNRMICTREREPGALFYIITCHTYAEIRRRQLQDQNTLEGTQNHVMIGNATGAASAH